MKFRDLVETPVAGNRNFKGYFWAIGKVPKRLQDVNHASQRSEMREGRQREGPSLPFCRGYSQELRHRGRFEMCEGQGEVLASEMERDRNELNWVGNRNFKGDFWTVPKPSIAECEAEACND